MSQNSSASVVIRLVGGLGNQLFQYAAARRLAYVNQIPLYLDVISGFERDPYKRSFSLNNFNIQAFLATRSESYAGNFRRCIRYSLRKRDLKKDISHRTFIGEQGHDFIPELMTLKIKKSIYLEGYWQNEKYFHDIKDIIHNELTLKSPVSNEVADMHEQISQCRESVCLHIRCHYYLNQNYEHQRVQLDEEYYRNAILEILQYVQQPHFFIFSDDPKWIKENFVPTILSEYDYTLVDERIRGKDFEILFLMTGCRYFILSYSTLCWWGAWLSLYKNKRVVAPEPERLGNICNWSFGENVPVNWILI